MFNSYKYSESFDDLLRRTIQHAKQNKIDKEIVDLLRRFFEKEMNKENRPFSRPERIRLLQQVTKAIMEDVIAKFDNEK